MLQYPNKKQNKNERMSTDNTVRQIFWSSHQVFDRLMINKTEMLKLTRHVSCLFSVVWTVSIVLLSELCPSVVFCCACVYKSCCLMELLSVGISTSLPGLLPPSSSPRAAAETQLAADFSWLTSKQRKTHSYA